MAERRWTDAQRAAIEDEGGALLVSAAAGSGKTAVLVERAVRLITQPDNPIAADRLLVVTFTNAAAEELRGRMAQRLEDALRQNPDSTHLKRQRVLLRRAAICTIDAFCQQFVKENFARLDIPPDVSVADGALLEQLSQQAIEETMEMMYEMPGFPDFVSLYGRSRTDRPAADAILALYDFTRTLPHPNHQLERLAGMYDVAAPLDETLWGEELFRYGEQAARACVRLLQEGVDACREEEALAVYIPTLKEDLAGLQTLLACTESRDWDGACRALNACGFSGLRPVRGDSPGKTKARGLRDKVKKIVVELKEYCFVCTVEEFEQDRTAARPMVRALAEGVKLYGKRFYAAKLAERVLDFSDFEHLALELLQNEQGRPTEIAQRVSSRYDVVMVDEYQDTNDLQNALYECLAKPDGSNLFFVGDVKQSIYRFRKANPGIFLAKKDRWAPHGHGKYPAVITLGHNFRSGQGVIGGVNFLFGALMSPELGEIEYNETEHLIQGGEGGDPEGVELRIVEAPEDEGDAGYVAGRIRQMVQDGYRVREDGAERPCHYGDFCILLRVGKHARDYVAALEELGIPVVAGGGTDLLNSPEVLPVTAALAAIDNPGDDVSLAATLLGPLFGFTMDEVTRLRADSPRGSLWGALLHSRAPRMQGFVRTIGAYRAMAGSMPAGRLCEELVESTGYFSAVAAMEGGAARRENLRRFIAWAGEVSAGGRGGLAGFVRLLRGGKGPEAPAAFSLPGHVTVLTIHKSKGLEFPVCFLADAAHRFNLQDLNNRVQMHPRLGIGLALRAGGGLYATAPSRAIRHRALQEALSEEMRILYVALTRAREKLIITFADKNPQELLRKTAEGYAGGAPDAFLLSGSRSMAGWLTAAALCHPDAGPLLRHCGGMLPVRLSARGRMAMSIETAVAPARAQQQAFELTAQPDLELAARLRLSFAARPARVPLSQVPIKASVSELAKGNMPPLRSRPSFMAAGGLTAAEKGTVQHSFLQFADFTAAKADLEAEISRLTGNGYLEQAAADILDRGAIGAFLRSPLMERIQNAERVLREYDFITAVPARALQPDLPPALADEPVLVQGIADLVLVFPGHAEIVDYKTDCGKTAGQFVQRYSGQLAMYRQAVQKRLGLPVNRLTIWAFSLGQEVEVPLPPEKRGGPGT